MKTWSVYGRFKHNGQNEGLEPCQNFQEAKRYVERMASKPNCEFDLFGIDVFDSKVDDYVAWWIYKDGAWIRDYELRQIALTT